MSSTWIKSSLDADEALWKNDPTQTPSLNIRLEYIYVPKRQSQQLFVQVSNRARFPTEQLTDIFATQWYTSRKAFIKGLTRGALGNALKTLLGIPYALRNQVAGDWSPELKPLSIICDGVEYLPRYIVDSTAQTIHLDYGTKDVKYADGTTISVGLDHFEQEMPRTLAQVQVLALQYHLCNPHARFYWVVEIEGDEWSIEYTANPNWISKLREIAPVQWYSPTDFQNLLGALHRKHCNEDSDCELAIEYVLKSFYNLASKADIEIQDQSVSSAIIDQFGKSRLSVADIEGNTVIQLHRFLCSYSMSFDSIGLGSVGAEHIRTVLSSYVSLESQVFYEIATDSGDDPNTPFVIEAAAVRLNDGNREIWTDINFSPTYGDPFLRRWLYAPIKADKPVLGLRGLLDTYEVGEDTPVLVYIHLICPTVEHHEFSKTEINHLPFKRVLGQILDRVLTRLRQASEEESLRLEQVIVQALDSILSKMDKSERFIFDQLLEKLRLHLSENPALSAWLSRADAPDRLQTYLARYQSVLTQHVARLTTALVSIPLHPDRHFSVMAEHISPDLLAQHHINKLLYVQVPELEAVIIENGWLCQLDMALLRNPPQSIRVQDPLESTIHDALVQSATLCDLPILVIHNADDMGNQTVNQMRTWLDQRYLDPKRIVDLGLDNAARIATGPRLTRLVQMMPGELFDWLYARLTACSIPTKFMPSDTDIRRAISARFEHLLLGHLWEGVAQQFEMTQLIDEVDKQLCFTDTMWNEGLDDQVKDQLKQLACVKSYTAVLEEIVEDFFNHFMHHHRDEMRALIQVRLGK